MNNGTQGMVQAFLTEYRQLAGGAEAVLGDAARTGAALLGLDLKRLASLSHLTHVLRDAGHFLNFPQLAAVARALFELLRLHGGEGAAPSFTPPQTRLLVAGFQLAARLVEGIASKGVEPRLDAELARFAADARVLNLPWEFSEAGSSAPASLELSDSQKVADLLADTPAPAVPAPAPAAAGTRTSVAVDMLNVFLQDAEEILDHAEQDLLVLDKDPEKLHDLLRQFHTLKGTSGLMGYDV
jgi:hypothetical protein